MGDGTPGRIVRVVRTPGETWVAHLDTDGTLVDLMLKRDGERALYGALHLARLSRGGGRAKAATATLVDGSDVWLDPVPETCALTGRPATDGALLALRIVEEARPGKLPRAGGRIELRGRRLALIAGERGVRLSHRLTGNAVRKALADRLAQFPKEAGAWLAGRWAVDDGPALAEEADALRTRLDAVRRKASMASAPRELLPPTDPIEECLLERVPPGRVRVETNGAALKSAVEPLLGAAFPAGEATVDLDLGLAPPWFDPEVVGGLEDALATTVAFAGGCVHVEPTQALTAVDVDGDPEQGFAQVNRRAAETVLRQLRLRDLGGIVVIDPAGPGTGQTAKAMVAALEKRAPADPYTVKVQQGGAGLVALVRTRRRPSLPDRLGDPDTGRASFAPSAATVALRALARCVHGSARARGARQRLEIAAPVAHYLGETRDGRTALDEARRMTATEIIVAPRQDLRIDDVDVTTEGEGRHG